MAGTVKLSIIVEGIELQDDQNTSYLNLQTGKVVTLTDDDFLAAEVEDESMFNLYGLNEDDVKGAKEILSEQENYLVLPTKFDLNEYGMMERFCSTISNSKIRDSLGQSLIGSGAYRRFKEKIHILAVQDEWYRFRDEEIKKVAIQWCREHRIIFTDDLPSITIKNQRLTLIQGGVQQNETEIKLGCYRHYKGKEYEVIGVAKHSESLEDYIVYKALYDEEQLWVRPRELFLRPVKVNGVEQPRFEYLGKR